ncbi:hypothetical protein AB6E21_18535 [Photobacterium swingsii]|uniref:hypothetical protein n=1 Tax=Photobacterium swingsii TaxID=680026 RepID=UPI00354F1642
MILVSEIRKNNPHQIVKKQHVFPKHSLTRFCNDKGLLIVKYKSGENSFLATPSNPVFYANRLWNEHAESGLMKSIEDEFQLVVSKLLAEQALSEQEHLAITKMYALWKFRSEIPERVTEPLVLDSSMVYSVDDQDEAERLEKGRIYFFQNGQLSRQMCVGIALPYAIEKVSIQVGKATTWGIVRAIEGQFIIPDTCPDLVVIPVSPSVMLTAKMPSADVGLNVVDEFNHHFIKLCKKYYFAHPDFRYKQSR